MSRPLVAVVLAAGQGTRMRSELPKVAHRLAGRPLVVWVVDAVAALAPEEVVVVVGHRAENVADLLAAEEWAVPVRTVLQPEQRGTGDAVGCALASLDPGRRDILVVPGDMPLIGSHTLREMVARHDGDDTAVTLLTAFLDDPQGYGRVVREMGGSVARIVEEADCAPDQREINEVAVSTYVFSEESLRVALDRLRPDNAQGELYLTDAIAALFPDVDAVAGGAEEVMGINARVQLAEAAARMRRRVNERWMREGVSIVDPDRTYVDACVELAPDVTLLPGCVLEGRTRVGSGTTVGPDTRLVDAVVGSGCALAYSVVRESEIGDGADVGPYASLRPGTVLGPGAHVGTFVELKNAAVGAGAKVPHLSYVGDCEIGEDSNFGANTITCNYDGRDKHRTVVGRGVKTGSGTLLVAPLTLGDDAYTGAGAVVTKDVPPGAMAKGGPAAVEEGWTAAHRGLPERD